MTWRTSCAATSRPTAHRPEYFLHTRPLEEMYRRSAIGAWPVELERACEDASPISGGRVERQPTLTCRVVAEHALGGA